ncbi:MAG: GLPGLI family protein [Chitinophagaceae bacterium]
MKKIAIFLSILFISFSCFSQNTKDELPALTFKGKITFERKQNTHKQLDDMSKKGRRGSMTDALKKSTPKYKIDFFELYFNQDESIYKLAKDGLTESKMMFGNMPADRNIVYKNQTKNTIASEKFIFENTYLLKDSIPSYKWKITEEFRKIAGYNCRRAETIIMDSIYVIAFYTDAIINPSGPENFNGLPGMILGIVLPRLNVTYFATRVDQYLSDEKIITPPTKGKTYTRQTLNKELVTSLKQWGDYLQPMLWWVNL